MVRFLLLSERVQALGLVLDVSRVVWLLEFLNLHLYCKLRAGSVLASTAKEITLSLSMR